MVRVPRRGTRAAARLCFRPNFPSDGLPARDAGVRERRTGRWREEESKAVRRMRQSWLRAALDRWASSVGCSCGGVPAKGGKLGVGDRPWTMGGGDKAAVAAGANGAWPGLVLAGVVAETRRGAVNNTVIRRNRNRRGPPLELRRLSNRRPWAAEGQRGQTADGQQAWELFRIAACCCLLARATAGMKKNKTGERETLRSKAVEQPAEGGCGGGGLGWPVGKRARQGAERTRPLKNKEEGARERGLACWRVGRGGQKKDTLPANHAHAARCSCALRGRYEVMLSTVSRRKERWSGGAVGGLYNSMRGRRDAITNEACAPSREPLSGTDIAHSGGLLSVLGWLGKRRCHRPSPVGQKRPDKTHDTAWPGQPSTPKPPANPP